MGFPGIPEAALEDLAGPGAAECARLHDAVCADPALGEDAVARLLDYGRLLLAGNTVASLTGARDWPTLVDAHLVDCVRAAHTVPEDADPILDWGSGAGLPGLAWACLWPERTLHLCERTGKKAAFLREAAERLGATGVQVHARPGEEAWQALRPRPRLVVARAVEPLPRLLRRVEAVLPEATPLLAMAGPTWPAAWEESDAEARGWALAAVDEYALDGDRGARVVLHLLAPGPRGGRKR